MQNANASLPFYVGLASGYGSTTWHGLVPTRQNENDAMFLSTPKAVHEGGILGSIFAGYEFSPYFALEASYARYPNAKLIFDESSLVTFKYGVTTISTRSELYALMAKIMLVIPCTQVRAFSSFGVGDLHRSDMLKNAWRLSPTFAFGFNYKFHEHWMAELASSYTGGYGESELDPSEDFIPFLYAAYLRLAYLF